MNAKLTINNNRTAATAGDNTLYSEKRPSACVRVCASWSVTREDTTAAKKNDKRIQTHTRSRVQREKTRRKSIPGHACRSIVFVTSALVSDSMYYVSASRFANTQNIGSNMSVMCRCIEFSQYQHAVCCMLYAVYERIEPRRKFQCSKWPGSMPWQTVLNTNNNNESNVIEVNVFCVLLFFFLCSYHFYTSNWIEASEGKEETMHLRKKKMLDLSLIIIRFLRASASIFVLLEDRGNLRSSGSISELNWFENWMNVFFISHALDEESACIFFFFCVSHLFNCFIWWVPDVMRRILADVLYYNALTAPEPLTTEKCRETRSLLLPAFNISVIEPVKKLNTDVMWRGWEHKIDDEATAKTVHNGLVCRSVNQHNKH